jgi:lysophospholipase L1-like esterase
MEALGYFGMFFSSKTFDFLSNNNYFLIRNMLRGKVNADEMPRYLSVPYLGYIPYPGYRKFGVEQHNMDGYRGGKIPLRKNNKLRILCVGGSTTYGFAVDLPNQTYPAQLEKVLDSYIKADTFLSKKYIGVEVLNAGLEAGTSADELIQYELKYRYYQPDVVIVHSGINDAFLMNQNDNNFQLDYTHFRRINFHLEPLYQPAAFLLNSYFISFLTIRLFYYDFTINTTGFQVQASHTFSKWTSVNIDSIVAKQQLNFYPFYNNTQALYRQILKDGAQLLVLPNITNKKSPFMRSNPQYHQLVEFNLKISKTLCEQTGALCLPFTYDSIHEESNWVDDCHLNSKGEENKAEVIAPFILNLLKTCTAN